MLDPRWLDDIISGLRAAGYAPYLLLESWEDDLVRGRFAVTRAVSAMGQRPAIEYHGPINVRVLRLGGDDLSCGDRPALPHAVPAP